VIVSNIQPVASDVPVGKVDCIGIVKVNGFRIRLDGTLVVLFTDELVSKLFLLFSLRLVGAGNVLWFRDGWFIVFFLLGSFSSGGNVLLFSSAQVNVKDGRKANWLDGVECLLCWVGNVNSKRRVDAINGN